MLNKIFALSFALALSGCGTVNAQPYGYDSALPGCHEEYRTVYDSFYGSRTVTTTVCSPYNSYRSYDRRDDRTGDASIFLFGTILGATVGSQFNNHRHYRENYGHSRAPSFNRNFRGRHDRHHNR